MRLKSDLKCGNNLLKNAFMLYSIGLLLFVEVHGWNLKKIWNPENLTGGP